MTLSPFKQRVLKSLPGHILAEYPWFRRWIGGHWERWWMDRPIENWVWLSRAHGSGIPGLGRGVPQKCEDHPPLPVDMVLGHYKDERFCDHCDADTSHWCRDSTHERDSSGDWRECQVCYWEYSGMTGKYSPPEYPKTLTYAEDEGTP